MSDCHPGKFLKIGENVLLSSVMGLPVFLLFGGDANGKLTYIPKYKTSD